MGGARFGIRLVKTGERTHEGAEDRAKKGYCVGGRVFGYRNVHIFNGTDLHGNPRYSHTERVVEKKEAAVVRKIFQLYASGLGGKAIAKRLNNEGALAPTPFIAKTTRKCNRCVAGLRRRFGRFSAANCIAAS